SLLLLFLPLPSALLVAFDLALHSLLVKPVRFLILNPLRGADFLPTPQVLQRRQMCAPNRVKYKLDQLRAWKLWAVRATFKFVPLGE
ncbi:MAG: hypothetical protein QME74_04680, partial [Candidatus Edwardsbacteria bacterium]|nr:hypothetical protein [Candidatus Edwardsbacteria bacterium]